MSYITDTQAETIAESLKENFRLPSADILDWDDDIKDALLAQVLAAQKDCGEEIIGEALCDMPKTDFALLFADPLEFARKVQNAVYMSLENDLRLQMTQAIAANTIRALEHMRDAALISKHEAA